MPPKFIGHEVAKNAIHGFCIPQLCDIYEFPEKSFLQFFLSSLLDHPFSVCWCTWIKLRNLMKKKLLGSFAWN